MRRFGQEISGNRQKHQELSDSTRSAILTALRCGQKKTQIARDFGCSRQAIYNTLTRFKSTKSTDSRARIGRPKKLSNTAIRQLYRIVRRFPKITWKELISEIPTSVSEKTIKRALRQREIRRWKAKKRIFLKPIDAQRRREFVKNWSSSTNLKNIIFSDESSIQRKPNSDMQYVFQLPNERLRPDLVNLMP